MTSSIKAPGIRDAALRSVINPIFKDEMTWTYYSEETNCEFFEVNITLGPKGSNPLHYHTKNDEIFTAGPKGLGVQLDDTEFFLKPGESARVPVRRNHRFFNPLDEEITFNVRGEPGSDGDGFAKGIYIVYGLARDGLTDKNGIPRNILHLAVYVYLTDTWVAGWGLYLMSPFLRAAYTYARWSGVEAQLLKKYWEDYRGSARNW